MQKSNARKVHDIEPLKLALRREYLQRCQKNPAYSMRAFAKFLELDQSFLSKLMRGQRSVSKETAAAVSAKLGLKPSESGVESVHNSGAFLQLMDDEFSVISDWHHFAILELAKTKGFRPEPETIAKRLGIRVEEVDDALERLQRLSLIRYERGTFSLNSPNNTWTNTKATTEARRLLQKRLLERGVEAIETTPFDLRENGSLTVAIDQQRLPEFKERLRQIRIELGSYFQADSNLNEVYQLTISFFPLTKAEGDGL